MVELKVDDLVDWQLMAAAEWDHRVYAAVALHPTRANALTAEAVMAPLAAAKTRAAGSCRRRRPTRTSNMIVTSARLAVQKEFQDGPRRTRPSRSSGHRGFSSDGARPDQSLAHNARRSAGS